MSESRDRRSDLALVVAAVGVLAWTAAVVLGLRRPAELPPLVGADLLWAGSFSAFLALGAMIARRRPENPVGWCLAVGPVCIGAGVALFEYVADTSRPAVEWVGLAASPVFDLGLLLLGMWPLWYPDGRLPSPRWRWLLRLAVVVYGVGVLIQIVTPTPYAPSAGARSPLAIDNELVAAVDAVTGMAIPIIVLVGFVSLVVRYRAADERRRNQLKTLVYAVAVVLTAGVALAGAEAISGPTPVTDVAGIVLTLSALLSIPTAVAVAIVRHRAFDIDRAISRTLAYALISAIAVTVYAGSVLALGTVARSLTGETGDLVVALSTLVVAAAFQPVRRWVQRGVDRRFNRARVDALRAADEFGRRLRDEVDLTAVVADLRTTVVRTLEPASASVVTLVSRGGGTP